MEIVVLRESEKIVLIKPSASTGGDYIAVSSSQLKYFLSLKPPFHSGDYGK